MFTKYRWVGLALLVGGAVLDMMSFALHRPVTRVAHLSAPAGSLLAQWQDRTDPCPSKFFGCRAPSLVARGKGKAG